MADSSDVAAKLTLLADSVLDDLLSGDADLEQRLEGLKVVGTLHLGLSKLRGKLPDDTDDAGGPSMHDMRKRVAEAGK